jgi:hypothetical protein
MLKSCQRPIKKYKEHKIIFIEYSCTIFYFLLTHVGNTIIEKKNINIPIKTYNII